MNHDAIEVHSMRRFKSRQAAAAVVNAVQDALQGESDCPFRSAYIVVADELVEPLTMMRSIARATMIGSEESRREASELLRKELIDHAAKVLLAIGDCDLGQPSESARAASQRLAERGGD